MNEELTRCNWCGDDPLYRAYHDFEWGVPRHDDRILFVCYAFMQAVGMVNDHTLDCFRYEQVRRLAD